MTLMDQALLRADRAFVMGVEALRWVSSEKMAAELHVGSGDQLAGIVVEVGTPRSECGLDLVLAR